MGKRSRHQPTMTELLRAAVKNADTLLGIERATGVARCAIRRFRDGKQSLRLDMADKLARHFRIVSKQTKRKR